MDLLRPIATGLKQPKNAKNRFLAKMAAKTTSGSGSDSRFVFYALDLVENEYNVEGVRRIVFEIFGAKFQKFLKKIKRVTRTLYLQFFDILWPLWSPITVPKIVDFG